MSAVAPILTNVAILPAIVTAWNQEDYSGTMVYSFVFFASCAYHLCRGELLCPATFDEHKMLDYAAVYTSISWVMANIGIKRAKYHVTMFVFYQAISLAFILSRASEATLPVVGIFIPSVIAVIKSLYSGQKMFKDDRWAVATCVSIGIGGCLMFFAPADTYYWSHSAWHVFAMLAICFAQRATFELR